MQVSLEKIFTILGEEVVKNYLLQEEVNRLQAVIKEWTKDDEVDTGDADPES